MQSNLLMFKITRFQLQRAGPIVIDSNPLLNVCKLMLFKCQFGVCIQITIYYEVTLLLIINASLKVKLFGGSLEFHK